MKAQIIKPTSANQETEGQSSVFLAGSIEMGAAEDWQVRVQEALSDLDVTLYNPRRDEWDSSWEQRETNPEFNHQVNWEMSRLEEAEIIFLYFSPETKSPISLLELGVHSGDRPSKLIVCCPDGFWRKGNVEIVCSRNGIPLFNDLPSAIASLRTRVISSNRW
jgi:hypothetical protein